MKHKNDKTKAAVYSYVNSLLWHRKTKYHVNKPGIQRGPLAQ